MAEWSTTPTRDWLTALIAEACEDDCDDCVYGMASPVSHRKPPCAVHAAEAVLDAVRGERLFIMPQPDADAILIAERDGVWEQAVSELAAALRVRMPKEPRPPVDMFAGLLVRVRELAEQAKEGR